MNSTNPVATVHDLRRRERYVIVPMFMLAGYATWYWTGSHWAPIWCATIIAGVFIDTQFFGMAARQPRLTPSAERLLTGWVALFATIFASGGLLALSSGLPEAFIAVMAGLTCATIRNASDLSVSPMVGAGSVLPSISVAIAVPMMSPVAWHDPVGTVVTLAAVLAMVGYTLLHAMRRAAADRAAVRLAELDPLTGLFNRRAFMMAVEHHFHRRALAPFAILYIDLDGFKPINDALGHGVGDKLLERLADKLRGDGDLDIVARLGGDEFAVVAHGPSEAAWALALAARIGDLLAEPLVVEGHAVAITASVGVALSKGPATTASEMILGADAAMLWAKARGAKIRLHDEALDMARTRDAGVEAALRAAIPREEFIAFHQPIVALADGRVIGWEALMRWDHPTRGILPPADFIDVAEATGLIDAMFWPMFRRAAARHVARDDGTFLAVNLALTQILDERFAARLRDVLTETGLAPGLLEIEITEREPARDVERLAARLHGLVALGVRVALDDFGTGGANLTLLRTLPIHTVKIDRSFVADILADTRDERIVASMVALARSMGVTLTAEGIETEAVAARLKALGCEQGQGYFYGRPSLHGRRGDETRTAGRASAA